MISGGSGLVSKLIQIGHGLFDMAFEMRQQGKEDPEIIYIMERLPKVPTEE